MGKNGIRKMNGSKTTQMKLPVIPKNWRLGGSLETVTPNKVKFKDRIAF